MRGWILFPGQRDAGACGSWVKESLSVRVRDGVSALRGWQSPPLVSRFAAFGVAAALVPDLPSLPPTTLFAMMSRTLGRQERDVFHQHNGL